MKLKYELSLLISRLYPVRVRKGPCKGMLLYGQWFYNRRPDSLFEEEKLYTNLDLQNKVVMDIGAHIGVYTLLFAKLFGGVRIVSFEPNPDCFSLLCKNIRVNGLTNVTALQVGASNEGAVIYFASNKYNTAKGTFRRDRRRRWNTQGKANQEREIPVKRIDTVVKELGLDCLDFVKIDTEGFEPYVIEGMSDSLERFHPLLYFEIHGMTLRQKKDDLLRIARFLSARGYRTYRLVEGLPEVREPLNADRVGGGYVSYDVPSPYFVRSLKHWQS